MMTTCQKRDNPAMGTVYGEEVRNEDFDALRVRLAGYEKFIGGEMSDNAIWKHMILLKKAEAAGIEVSDDEVADRVQDFYKSLEARVKVIEQLQQMRREMPNIP